MAVFVNETFTAADGTNVDSLTGWDEHSIWNAGRLLIQSNRAYVDLDRVIVYNTATPASADYAVEATLYVVTAGSATTANGPVGRLDTAALTYYEFVYLADETRWRLARYNDNNRLELGSYTQTLTATTSYVAKLDMVGDVIKGYVDGVERVAVTDPVPLLSAGKAGYKGGGLPVTSTTGLHVDALTATDASAPTGTGTYVGVGAAALTQGNATVNPALPGGLAVDDLMVLVGFERSSSGGFTTPTGWTQVGAFSIAGSKSRVYTRFYQTGDTAPALQITTNATGGIAQVAAFRGIDKTTTVDVVGAASGTGTIADIGPISGITPSVAGALVLVVGLRHRDWTSVATLSGDGLTWNEIAEPDSAASPLIGLVWDYAIISGNPVAITNKTFTVTSAGTALWQGFMLAFRPATTVPTPTGKPSNVRLSGVFTATKPVKRRAAGVFATKPIKVIGDKPPPPPPVGEPTTATLGAVPTTTTAAPLTYTATPPVYNIFPALTTTTAPSLSYLFHPPPDNTPTGMRILMFEGQQNVAACSEADLATLKSYGIDGFYLQCGSMLNMGGGATNWNDQIAYCKNFADTHPQFKVYFGFNLANRVASFTPGASWFDDATWANVVLPNFQTLAHAVNDSALVGLSMDGEDYAGVTNGWRAAHQAIGQAAYNEGGTSYSDSQVRAKVKVRAKSVADTICAITGPVEVAAYYLKLPGSFKEAQEFGGLASVRPGTASSYDDYVTADWIDGLTSNSQFKLRHLDAAYYKPNRLAGFPDWPSVYAFDKARYDGDPQIRKPNSFHTPFIWITEGPNSRGVQNPPKPCYFTHDCADRMFSVGEVRTQLQAARVGAEGGEFALYDQGYIAPPTVYAQFAADIQAASL